MATSSPQASALAAFDAAAPAAAERDVLTCCASRAFARAITAGRPYREPGALDAAVVAAFTALSWDDILEGMSAHPRIGDRSAQATRARSRGWSAAEQGWSAAEQSGAAAAGEVVRQGLADGNLAYEERFGHVFLICATGLSGAEMLTQLRARLAHDDSTERTVVRRELLKITQLRMAKLLSR
ncbi:MAG: 2-oxo-4-hydroxy-4-carboxy-5-ureidoimidazoline decarboxylase [Streptosporangiaceae bacterium]|jgi:2-oxo-4-hydroxy-4-carboxy-5-ureidoimidazoline decarboxylase